MALLVLCTSFSPFSQSLSPGWQLFVVRAQCNSGHVFGHHCNIIRPHIKGGLFWAAGLSPRPPCSQGLSATRFSCTRTLPSRTSAPHTRGLSPTRLVWLVVLCSTTGKPKGEEGEPCTKSRDTAWSSERCTRDQENKLESCR